MIETAKCIGLLDKKTFVPLYKNPTPNFAISIIKLGGPTQPKASENPTFLESRW